MAVVACSTCHRRERWGPGSYGGTAREVLVEGGSRQPVGSAEEARARAALAAVRGDRGAVVGDCPACGQPLHLVEGTLPWADVSVETDAGVLRFGDDGIHGPSGPLAAEEAEALIDQRFPRRRFEGLAGDVGRMPFFLVLLPPILGWGLAALFVLSFLASIVQGAPQAVQGTPGFDRTANVPENQEMAPHRGPQRPPDP